MTELTIADEIQHIEMERRHVVLIGAGASRAAFPNGDANGQRLPLMADFMEIVPVQEIFKSIGIDYKGRNFEELYARLYNTLDLSDAREELDSIIFRYFSSLKLPDVPTLYDYLVLSLRKKDVIATFNWDPFLVLALRRNRIIRDLSPHFIFLHGNVAIGYCRQDNVVGIRGNRCTKCGKPFESSKLLYPIGNKDYESDPAIANAWREVKQVFKSAFMVTVFGYGAPKSDTGAIKLLSEAWGNPEKRAFEQFDIIDIRSEDQLQKDWNSFIYSHHYEVFSDYYKSWLFNHPRRTGEAYINQNINASFIENNPPPLNVSFDELWQWFEPLLEVERDNPDK